VVSATVLVEQRRMNHERNDDRHLPLLRALMASIRSIRPRPSLPGCTGILRPAGFEVWFDRMAMPSRGLTFYQQIQDAVAARERAKSRPVG
jgi:hypothetical protein